MSLTYGQCSAKSPDTLLYPLQSQHEVFGRLSKRLSQCFLDPAWSAMVVESVCGRIHALSDAGIDGSTPRTLCHQKTLPLSLEVV